MTYLDPIRQAAQEFAPPPQEPEHHFADFDKEDPALKPVQASMTGSHFDDFDKEAPKEESTGEGAPGSRKTQEFARGIYRAGLGTIGAVKDIIPAITQGKEMTSGAKMIHELGLDVPEDATFGEKLAGTAGQLFPGVLTGFGLTGKVLTPLISDIAASQVFGPAGEKIGQKLGLAPGRAQALGIAASMAGSGGTATGIQRVAGRFKPPTGEQILDSAQKGYSAVTNMPIIWDPNAIMSKVTGPLRQRMEDSGGDITAPSAYKMLGKLEPSDKEIGLFGGIDNGRLWGVQKNLKELAKQTDAQGHYTPDAHFAGQTVKAINEFMEAAKDNPNWALSGSEHLPTMSSTLAKANQDYSSAMWDDTFGKAYEKAKLRASTVTTGGNLPNNVRQEFAKFLDPFHPARALGLTPDELTQVNQIARGKNRTQNMLRGMGGVAPESKLGLYAQATGLGMAAGGNLGGLMLPAVGVMGSIAKRMSNKLQKGQIENLRNTVRSRSALAQSMRAGPHGGAGEEAGEAAEAGLAGILGEEAPEWVNRAAGAGADTGANAEKEKEAEGGGGYSMGHRLLKAVGGYDSSYFNGPYSAIESGSAANTTQPTPADIVNTNMELNRRTPYAASLTDGQPMSKVMTQMRDYAQNPDIRQLSRDLGTAMAPIEAYHGSPYDFDQFKSEKIGTGEGAQAYGHGLYFAQSEGVAKSYRDQLTQWSHPDKATNIALKSLLAGNSPDAVGRLMKGFYPEMSAEDIAGKIKAAQDYNPPRGHMYQVEIGSEPEHFLDWDKPLSEQSQGIQDAIHKAGIPLKHTITDKQIAEARNSGREAEADFLEGQRDYIESNRDMTGQNALIRIANNVASEGYDYPAASKALQDAGIPGIRYLDQGSRNPDTRWIAKHPNGGIVAFQSEKSAKSFQSENPEYELQAPNQSTHNYVVFDPSIIRIMRKYGIMGPAAVAGSAMGQQKGKQGGGYDSPAGQVFADPEAFRLRMARLAAAPQTRVGGGQPMPQTAIGGGLLPMGNYQVGGYDAKTASDNPMGPDFDFGQATGGLLGAIGAGVNRGIIQPFANNVAGSIPAPYESPAAVAPALWNAIGRARGARRFGGYGMSAVSPLAGGGGY